jgi:ketosteroid isomerase-like protein
VKNIFIFCVAALLSLFFIGAASADSTVEVKQALINAAHYWNKGNVDEYVKIYDESPHTIYITHTITRGFSQIKKNLAQRFPTTSNMGRLSFNKLQFETLSSQYVLAIGQYRLARPKKYGGDAIGYFSCIFKHTATGWKITVDHSS